MVNFPEINQAPYPYSMLQHIGRVATPKLVPRDCLRYLQTTLIMGGGGLVSEFMWGIVGAGGSVVNSPNVDKGIATLTITINLNSYIENIKNRTL